MSSSYCNCLYAPSAPPQGWSGARMTSLDQIEAKTFHNMYSHDWYATPPYKQLECARTATHGTFPVSGYCVPFPEQQLVGLNASQVVAGENEMVLYTSFTRCVGEFDCRFMSQSM